MFDFKAAFKNIYFLCRFPFLLFYQNIEYTWILCHWKKLLTWTSLIRQFVHKIVGDVVKKVDGEIVILASHKFPFNRVHDNLM